MPYVELDIPSGVYKNGTELQSKGRWLSLIHISEPTRQEASE